ncbi:MAG TPA: hypothetical protein VMT54_21645 [Candidatus Cybelea sp.]|nr:hypothetical protein [Candidatus Cybelea sp.]
MNDQQPFPTVVFVIMFVIMIPIWVATIWAYVRIIQKAGYSGWYVLWGFVPIMNIVMLFYFAFAEWPVTKRLQELEHRVFGDPPEPRLGRPS